MLRGLLHRARNGVMAAVRGPTFVKQRCEMDYWKDRVRAERVLANEHFAWFFTTHFELEGEFYRDKRVLDLGCGPRGSLEWASMAAERVGLDPLVDSYRSLGIERHAMRYVAAPAEAIPFPDGHFDVVSSFNSLDHVDDLDRTIAEIARVTAPGGLFLLITEVDHPPTVCEPVTFSWDIADRFAAAFEEVRENRYEAHPDGVYDAIRADLRYDDANPAERSGWLSAMFRRR